MNDPRTSKSAIHHHSAGDSEGAGRGMEAAVWVHNATKSYGVGKRRSAILRSLDMTVKKGQIYGLLGASGCGKTTLLSCIVGRRSFDSGDVLVFGGEPGTPESGIPGRRVGYMPQELALYGEFTIKETLQYFGRIYDLSLDFVKSQMDFLFQLLDLPPGHRFVKTLSGGQQRRVSFAVALFHEPELLILDEPTVGVDPLLRHSIWDHLVRLSADQGRTVIITTHYIEEARQAHTIGMMRSGRLLAEESPARLLALHSLKSLEDVFLKLCTKDVENRKSSSSEKTGHDNPAFVQDHGEMNNTMTSDKNPAHQLSIVNLHSWKKNQPIVPLTGVDSIVGLSFSPSISKDDDYQLNKGQAESSTVRINPKKRSRTFRLTFPSAHRTGALLRKNVTQTFRNIGMFLFVFLLPALQAILFCLAIGRDPTFLKVAVVNEELDLIEGRVCNYSADCSYSMSSCRYLRHLSNETILQVPYGSHAEALEATRRGEVWGVIRFGQNFTEELMLRQADGLHADNATLVASSIGVNLDWSNQQISLAIQRRVLDAFEEFGQEFLSSCELEPGAASTPVKFLDPIYGDKNSSFTDFMAPGIILTIVYFIAVALTTDVLIQERKQGLLDRSLVAGVQSSEILLAHIANQFGVIVGQTTLVYAFMMLVFDINCRGSLPLAIFITLVQGLAGMCYGMVVSSLCDEENSAIQLALGSFYPNLLLSGVLWPMEGMPIFLRYVSYFLPQTYAVEALRNVFGRGWGIERPEVYMGIAISFGWIGGMIALSLIVIRVRKYMG